MAAVEIIQFEQVDESLAAPYLRLVRCEVAAEPFRTGRPVAERRNARARLVRRRHRTLVVLALAAGVVILAWPGHAFGGTTGAGLPSDLATSSVLASGMEYVVQPGDTVQSIARLMNPVDAALARAALVHELHSSVVVPGEHVLIP